MLTLFTIPKAFEGRIAVAQRNAIQSWISGPGECEVFVCGNDAGVSDVASEFRLHHLPAVRRNEYGTPMLDDAFSQVSKAARGTVLVYINSDIILVSDLAAALARLEGRRFLASGRRWNLDVTGPIDFSMPGWRTRLSHDIQEQGQMDKADAMDYFAFPSSTVWGMPAFAVGRPGWDNWMIYRARGLGIPVIDATEAVTIAHQRHAYGHVAAAYGDRWKGPEGDRNIALAGGAETFFTLDDATHRLASTGLRRISKRKRLHREIDILSARHPAWGPACRLGHAAVACGERWAAALRRPSSKERDA